MRILDEIYFGNTLETWLTALAVTAATFFVLKIFQTVILHRLAALAAKTATDLDDLVVHILRETRLLFLFLVSVYAGTYALTLPPHTTRLVQTLLVLALLLQGAIWGTSVISFWLGRMMKRRMEEDAASATTLTGLGFVAKLVLWSLVLVLALDNMGVNITGLVAGLGIGGVAVALALQNVLGDLFASLSIVLDKPFVMGDFIIVDEHLGTVEHVGLKTTRIRSLSGEQLIFSNADLLRSRIRNFKRMSERRVVFTIGVTYQTPYEKLSRVSSLLREIIESQASVRFDRAHFKQYGDFALIYEVVYYVLSSDYNIYMDIQQTINLEIYRRFEQESVEFAYPTQTLFVTTDTSKQPLTPLTRRPDSAAP
jgi:small-conductance mechanosensitive channel